MPKSAAADSDSVNALVRGFEVLDCVAGARRPLTLAEVAQLTAIPKPTTLRLLTTLVRLGHLRAAREGQGYEMASGVVRLAEAFLGATGVRQWARPHLVSLAEVCGATAFLGVRDADEMLVVEAARSRSAVALIGADVGTRMPLSTSSLGRAWLAGVDEPTRMAVLTQLKRPPAALRAPAARALDAALARAQRDGFALSIGEFHTNISAAAVPIRTPSGEVVAINCGGPSFLIPQDTLERQVVPRLVRAAQALARDIGGIAGTALTSGGEAPVTAPRKRKRASTASA
jgi:DNA-binding IclR family transcriptional regulator